MGAVDTNVLVRLLVADDPAQTGRATAFLEARRPLWVSTVVLVETVWVLTTVYHWSKAQIMAMLKMAANSRDFTFQAVQTVNAALELYASCKADFSDCLALELARAEGHLPFATFDKATAKLRDVVVP
ncbi:MAG TPA: type II toxin-antitoxin system VapC family toxin [Candidatus Saccharimonadales bacterium]|jgi:predicted nucleic-acid-binding protein|nr:type II toxin-antitoxin system VapC family toxin [Candidatus Saccharimonadales bacterium]